MILCLEQILLWGSETCSNLLKLERSDSDAALYRGGLTTHGAPGQ
ncbi:unnamed protein product [Staurois parvus]|uniref:Uncharacterized protein n=1 Tax=Staurois parvus TaxID=386267 RepID=A0ABN9EGV1_9NEOB|nr:unnamed protein product [Staurois parvus]